MLYKSDKVTGMKQNSRRILLFFLFSVVIGVTISIIARSTSSVYLFVSAKSLQDYAVSIEAEKESIKKLHMLTAENYVKLAQYEASLNNPDDNSLEETLVRELEQAAMLAGASDLTGPGVIVKFDDGVRPLYSGEDPNSILVHDRDLLDIINELNMSGAEAISINDQRIVNMTELACAGYSVKVNNVFIARPFIIKAIGDPKMLKAGLMSPPKIGHILLAWGLIFEVEEADEIVMKGMGNMSYQYMELVKEGDL